MNPDDGLQFEDALINQLLRPSPLQASMMNTHNVQANIVPRVVPGRIQAQQFLNSYAAASAPIHQWFTDEVAQPITESENMFQKILRLYAAYMMQDVRSPIPHLAGPPGVGKSSVVAQVAEILGVQMHILNVARLSPLEIEGIQMPINENQALKMLHSTIWTQLKEGDIVLLDEFMRGFPEVYNALLDIMTSREVAGFKLPKVFFIAASNSVAAYDRALEDRLLHLPVPDLRKDKKALREAMARFIDEAGFIPTMITSTELAEMFDNEVLPMYSILDQFTGKGSRAGAVAGDGSSVRKLLGQLQLREFQSSYLKDVVMVNNAIADREKKPQFYVFVDGKSASDRQIKAVENLPVDKLTLVQTRNRQLNLELVSMEQTLRNHNIQNEGTIDDYLID